MAAAPKRVETPGCTSKLTTTTEGKLNCDIGLLIHSAADDGCSKCRNRVEANPKNVRMSQQTARSETALA